MHTCSRCKETKPPESFTKDARYKAGLSSYCKDCYRVYGRTKRYKIDEATFTKMFEKQDGACAICSESLDKRGSGTHIDHCHTNGQVRGLLCRQCNIAIGCLKDDTSLLDRAKAYIELHNQLYCEAHV